MEPRPCSSQEGPHSPWDTGGLVPVVSSRARALCCPPKGALPGPLSTPISQPELVSMREADSEGVRVGPRTAHPAPPCQTVSCGPAKRGQSLLANCSPQAWLPSSPVLKAREAALTDGTSAELSVFPAGPRRPAGPSVLWDLKDKALPHSRLRAGQQPPFGIPSQGFDLCFEFGDMTKPTVWVRKS